MTQPAGPGIPQAWYWHGTVRQGSVRFNLTEEMSPPSLFLSCCTYSMEPTFWTLWNLEDGSYSNLHFGTQKMYSKKNLLYFENVQYVEDFFYSLNFDLEAMLWFLWGITHFYIYEHACLPVSRFQTENVGPVMCCVSRDFRHFLSKNSTWAPWTAKLFAFTKIFAKTCVHVVNDYADTVRVVNGYADTVSA